MADGRPERCERCRFWEPVDPGDGDRGKCLRHAPSPRFMQTLPEDTCLVFWPETFANEWCGEFAPRDPPPPGPPAAARARDPVGRWGQDLSDHSDEVDYLKGLSTRASGALRRSGIRRVSQLLTWDVAGLLDLPDFGPHSLAQVVAALAARGLALRGEAPSVDTRPPVRPQ